MLKYSRQKSFKWHPDSFKETTETTRCRTAEARGSSLDSSDKETAVKDVIDCRLVSGPNNGVSGFPTLCCQASKRSSLSGWTPTMLETRIRDWAVSGHLA